jgi:hypothetical protein
VFESVVLRKIFRIRRDEATGEWRRLHHEELYDLYYSPNIILAIKSRRMILVLAHGTYGGEERCVQGFG